MIELPMIFVAGILGAAHCLGMCGPIALMIGGSARQWSTVLVRQTSYTAGRIFTYGTLGAAAGFCGTWLIKTWPSVGSLPALLAIAAGTLLIAQGLRAAGLLSMWGVGAGSAPCLLNGFFGHFVRQRSAHAVFLAGLFTGFLPCGLLYGMLALAMSTHSTVSGSLTMVVFGLGTAPAMVLAGLSGRLIGLATRRLLFSVAAWCLIVTGAISVVRGASFILISGNSAAACPMCRHQE